MTATPDQVIAQIREPYSEPRLTCPHIDRLVEGGGLSQQVLDELFAIREINSQLRYGTWVLKARAEAAEAERDALRKENQKLHRRLQIIEGAFQSADHDVSLWEQTLTHHKHSNNGLLVKSIRAELDRSIRRARTLSGDKS